MSQVQAINFSHLDDFLQSENASEDEVQAWYERLVEYELDGNETTTEIELLYNGARFLMSFAFTAAEELRDVAENEAVAIAEKEDQWEEQRTMLREELESLRERITSKAEIGDSTEAFRAQIDSLKEENRQLQQSNRDRDREMADQRDRFENLASRVDSLTRERDALTDHKVRLEDTIRELNRRISSKSEDTTGDYESRRLRLRNEQVLTMSRQMQAVISQNEDLREEIDRVSDALEEATRIIEQSALRYTDISTQLDESQHRVQELLEQNRRITEGLPEKIVEMLPKFMSAAEKLKSGATSSDKIDFLWQMSEMVLPDFLTTEDYEALQGITGHTAELELQGKLQVCEEKIKSLHDELAVTVEESNRLRMMIREDTVVEKEAELEQLRKELVAATTLARNLFGEVMSEDAPGQDPTAKLQMRILQLEHSIEQMSNEIEEKDKSIAELTNTLEQKDVVNSEALSDLNRIKDAKFGSVRDEMTRLENQIKYRDDQIGKLQQHCTLLQVELGRYADGDRPITRPRPVRPSGPSVGSRIGDKNTRKPISRRDEPSKDQKPTPPTTTTTTAPTKPETPILTSQPQRPQQFEEAQDVRTRPSRHRAAGAKIDPAQEGEYMELVQQSVLISNLYFEMMQLLEEISQKDRQLDEMSQSLKKTNRIYEQSRAQLNICYDEIKKLKLEQTDVVERTLVELKESEEMETQRLIESISIGGTELERRMGETTRKLILERVERIRLQRQCVILKTKSERAEWAGRRIRDGAKLREMQDGRQMAKLKYQMDTQIIEIGRLQTRVLQSVPVEEYDNLSRKYKKVIKDTVGMDASHDLDLPRQSLSVTAQPSHDAEHHAKENMLKKMVDVITEQSEFWSREAAMLQTENEELKKFLEDIENESDVKSVLGAVERRLLDTIRELRENVRDKKKRRDTDNEAAADREKWRAERTALINVVTILQRENTNLRTQSIGTVSLQQLENLRKKIAEARENELMAKAVREKADLLQQDVETELLRVRAMRTASEMLTPSTENDVAERTERQLQMAYFNASQQSAKTRSAERALRLKERQLTEVNEELGGVKEWNRELLTTLENIRDFKTFKYLDDSKITKVEREDSRAGNNAPADVSTNNGRDQRDGLDRRDSRGKLQAESDYEMDLHSVSGSEDSSSSEKLVVRTIVQDNSKQFEARIREMKLAAETVLAGYKEQLAQKDVAIARYRKMLQDKIDEDPEIVERIEIVREEVRVPDEETEEKLEEAMRTIRNLEEELEEMTATKNYLLDEKKDRAEIVATGTQTDAAALETTRDEPEDSSSRHRNTSGESEPKASSAKSEKVRVLESEMALMRELMEKQETSGNETMRQKMEIRNLKARIQRLTTTNKELMTTCEQIKDDALAELSTFRRNNESTDERRSVELRNELDRTKKLNRSIRDANENLKNEIDRLKREMTMSSNKIDPNEWERRKRQEALITNLRRKLKESGQSDAETQSKLQKRDKALEDLRRDQTTRQMEIERLQKKIREIRNEKDVAVKNAEVSDSWRERAIVFEEQLKRKESELSTLSHSARQAQKEHQEYKSRREAEISEMRRDHAERTRKEVAMAKEAAKREMTIPPKPRLHTTSTQTRTHRSVSRARASDTEKSLPPISERSDSNQSGSSEEKEDTVSARTTISRSFSSTTQVIRSSAVDETMKTEMHEMRRKLRLTEIRLAESQERLRDMEKDHSRLLDQFQKLVARNNAAVREEKPTGAVLVLSDKLEAKDREILQLKAHIAHLERSVLLPI